MNSRVVLALGLSILAAGCGERSNLRRVTAGAAGDAATGDGLFAGDGLRDSLATGDLRLQDAAPDLAADPPAGDARDAAATDARDALVADVRDAGPGDVPGGILLGVGLTPALSTAGIGTTAAFVATGRFSDGTTRDVTAAAMWASSNPAVASIAGGLARGLGAGMTTISATVGGFRATATLTVTASPLTGISVDPVDSRLAVMGQVQLRATGTYGDGSKQDLTAQATWTSSAPGFAAVASGGMTAGQVTGVAPGMATVSAAFGPATGRATVTVTTATLRSIEITPTNPTLPLPGTLQMRATGVWSDGTTSDVSAMATWQSSDVLVLSVGPQGLATALAAGTSTVSARVGAITGSTVATVARSPLTRILVEPAMSAVPRGMTQALRATGFFADGTTANLTDSVAWSSTNESVATVSNAAGSKGLVTALAAGTASISANLSGVSGMAAITVTDVTVTALAITPRAGTVAIGGKLQYTATATFSDASTRDVTAQAVWSVADAAVAGISNAAGSAGQLSGLAAGTTTVSAALSGRMDSTQVTVTAASLQQIVVSPATATLMVGARQSFAATGVYSDGARLDVTQQVLWASDTPAVASISNAAGSKGQALGVTAGTTTIRAQLGGLEGTAQLTVTAPTIDRISVEPITATRRITEFIQFGALVIYNTGMIQNVTGMATWASSNPTVATVNMSGFQAGRATCAGVGTTMVTATFMGFSDSATLTCSDPMLVRIQVAPLSTTVRVGQTQLLNAAAIFSDGSMQNITGLATWSSSSDAIATVTNFGRRGVVAGVAVGVATITATYMGLSDSSQVTVTAVPKIVGLSVTPASPTLRVGQIQPFQAVAAFDDGSTQVVTQMSIWSSSNMAVADVTNAGMRGTVTALSAGTTSISASYMGFMDASTVTVSTAMLTGISVSPVSARIRVGQNQQFQATALYSDGTTQMVTGMAVWTSSDTSVADVLSIGGMRGLATGFKAGTATITATYMGMSDSASLTVTDAKLVALSVTPLAPTLLIGQAQQFQATAIYEDGGTQNVTNSAAWITSNATVLDLSVRGLGTGLAAGTATVTASYMGVMDTVAATVSGAKPKSLAVTPLGPTLLVGQQQQFQAVATYDDGSVRTVTAMSIWSSSDMAVADVTNTGGRGLATALKAGTATITASFMGLTDSSTVTVSAAQPKSLAVTPVNPTLIVGQQMQLQAVATYDDGSTRTVTGMSLWSSSDQTVADVSNTGGRGVVAALKAGTTTITATFMGLSGTTTVTVSSATLSSIQVTPINLSLPKARTQQYQAIGIYSDGSTQPVTGIATWASTNTAIADVSNAPGQRGLVTTIAAGMVEISATFMGVTGKTTLTVTGATVMEVQVTPLSATVAVGGTQQYTALAVYSDFSLQNVTGLANWTSSNNAVAVVSNAGGRGLATGVTAGSATITATFMGVAGTASITVSAAITQIQVTPVNPSSPAGVSIQFTATAIYSDNSTRDVTFMATWTSSDETVVEVTTGGGSRGLATALKAGMATIRATMGSVSGTSVYTVGAQTLGTITVAPAMATIARGATQQFTATGNYSDGSTYTLTEFVTWLSTSPSVAGISNVPGSRGLATGVAGGMTTIQAHFQGKVGTAALTVNP